jgi:DNA replication licensing factor MCM6
MDIDSSPGILPPSSNPTPWDSSQSRTPTQSRRTGTSDFRSRNTRTTTNALSLGDEEDPNAMEQDDDDDRPQAEEDGLKRGPRAGGKRARMNLDVPPVRDATGEKVMESFEQFLKM